MEKEVCKYKDLELQSIADFKTATLDIIDNYIVNNDLDGNNIHPLVWDDIIQELYLQLYSINKSWYKVRNNYKNEYDVQKVYDLFIYIFRSIHNRYKQTMTMLNFYTMLGISKQTMYNMSLDSVNNLSYQSFDLDKNNLAELIAEYCENSYVKALEGTTQHMKYLPTLNKRYGYNMPGTGTQTKTQIALVDRGNVEQIGQNTMPQLPQN